MSKVNFVIEGKDTPDEPVPVTYCICRCGADGSLELRVKHPTLTSSDETGELLLDLGAEMAGKFVTLRYVEETSRRKLEELGFRFNGGYLTQGKS